MKMETPTSPMFFQDVPVFLTRKRIRHLHLRIYPHDGRVSISAPWRMSLADIQSFLEKKWDWVLKHRHHFQNQPQAPEMSRQEIEAYRRQLKEAVPPLIRHYEEKMQVHVQSFGIRKMKTRWGTCNPRTAHILLNLHLAKRRPELLEYVVVHEMVHLLEASHNHRFKSLMDSFLPGWRILRKELKRQ